MGLVMQEPTLFNYSVTENVLYGNQTASNAAILSACDVSNSREFIESKELENAVDDNLSSILAAMKTDHFKPMLVSNLGDQEYEKKLKTISGLKTQEEKDGSF